MSGIIIFSLPTIVLLTITLLSAGAAQASVWQHDHSSDVDIGHRFILDTESLRASLATTTPSHRSRVSLPMPDGTIRAFDATASRVLHPQLAERYPQIRTYRATAVDDDSVTARITSGPQGISALVYGLEQRVFIDLDDAPSQRYRVYEDLRYQARALQQGQPASCAMTDAHRHRSPGQLASTSMQSSERASPVLAARTSGNLRSYRIAVAATAGFSSEVGPGSKANVLAEISNTINRVNEIYESYLGITLELVANNDQIILLTESEETAAFSSVSGFVEYSEFNLSAQLDENQALIDNVIGNANYDIGHVFSATGGGLASLGVVCDNGFKAEGATGLSGRSGDSFDVDLVAHEIGHQFNADHTFNGTSESCAFGRNAATAFEPGSGASIMSYAGLCFGENITSNVFAGFHAGSVQEIVDFSRSGIGSSCGSAGANAGNSAPDVNAGSDYTIPAGTPFVLAGSATDTDGDTLKYRWDEYDNSAQFIQATTSCNFGKDLVSNPLFRSFAESSNPVRYFPNIQDLTANALQPAETLPLTDRDINFRFTALDGKGGVDEDDVVVTVDSSKGPFMVLQPNGGESLDSNLLQTVEWLTACTELAPVSCTQVDIELSTDGGVTYTTEATTDNDGVHQLNFGGVSATEARLRVRCSNNIFLDLSNADFSLTPGSGSQLGITGNGGSGSCGTAESVNCAIATGDDIEPNNSVAQAQPITIPFLVSGAANEVLDLDDYFSFIATGGVYDISLSNFGSSDMDLYLIDSDGVTQLSESAGFLATTESIRSTLQAGRTYYVHVQAYFTAGLDQSYRLSIGAAVGSGTDIESNNSFDEAQQISVPFQLSGAVDDSGDVKDIFAFTAANGIHNFVLNNFGGNNLDLYVYDSARTLVASASSQFGQSEFITFALNAGSRYYVEVNAVETAGLESSYILSISPEEGSGGGSVDLALLLLIAMLLFKVRCRNSALS